MIVKKAEIQYSQSRFTHVLQVDHKEGDENIYAIYHAINMETIFIGEELADLFTNRQGTQIELNNNKEKVELPVFNLNKPPEGIKKEFWVKFIESLVSKEMILENEIKDDLILKALQEEKNLAPKVRIRLMYLLPTYKCNLVCKYCSIVSALESSESEKINQMMTKEIACKAIDVFFDSLHPHIKDYKIIF